MKKFLALFLAMVMVLSLVACGTAEPTATEAPAETAAPAAPAETAAPTEPAPEIKGEVNIYTTWADDWVLAFTDFVAEVYPDLTVNMVKMNGGEMINRVIAEGSNPQGDFLCGAGCESYIQLAEQGLLEPYKPAGGDAYPDYAHDADWNWFAFNLSYLGFYVDHEWCEANGVEIPDSWEDLLDPKLKGQIVVTNPGTSTTGYMVLSTLVQLMGEEEGLAYYAKLHENIKTYASGGSGPSQSVALGEAPIGIGYMQHGLALIDEGYTNMVISAPSEGTGLEVTGGGVIKGCKNEANAKAIADLVSSTEWAELNKTFARGIMYACGVAGAGLEEFADTAVAKLDYAWAAENKDRLIGEWDKITSK